MLPVLVGPGGGLRDPVPGPLQRGARRGRPAGTRGRARRERRRPGDRRGLRRDDRGLRASSRCRPSPLVRSFGLLLVIGIALAFVVALTGGLAALGLSAWRGIIADAPAPRPAQPGSRRRPAPVHRGRRDRDGLARPETGARSPACCSRSAVGWRAPGPGWRQTSATSRRRTCRALKDLNELEKETGISGDVNVTIKAPDPTSPAVISWAEGFQQRVLARHGFYGRQPELRTAPRSARPSRSPTSSGGRAARRERARARRPRTSGTFTRWFRRCPASSPRS